MRYLWLLLLLAGCAETEPHWECTQEEFTHFLMIYQSVTKTFMYIPQYRCTDSVWVVPPQPEEQDDGHRQADS